MLTGEPPEGHSRVEYWRRRWRRRRTSPPADARASRPSVRLLDAGPRWTHRAGYRSCTGRRRQLSRLIRDLSQHDGDDPKSVWSVLSGGEPRGVRLYVTMKALY